MSLRSALKTMFAFIITFGVLFAMYTAAFTSIHHKTARTVYHRSVKHVIQDLSPERNDRFQALTPLRQADVLHPPLNYTEWEDSN